MLVGVERILAGAGLGRAWPSHLAGNSSTTYGQHNLLTSHHQHPHKTIVLIYQNEEKEACGTQTCWMNVSFGDLLPFDPGSSCGVTLCIEIQTQRNRDLLPTLFFWFIVIVNNFSINPGFVVGKGGWATKRHSKRKWDNGLNHTLFFWQQDRPLNL